MSRKYLLAPALLAALSISNTHAYEDYHNWFIGTQAVGSVTFKLSGYCQGSVTLPLHSPYAEIRTGGGTSSARSIFHAYIDGLDSYVGSRFFSNKQASSATLTIQKGSLKFSAKTTSLIEGDYPTYVTKYNDLLGSASCKNGQTFKQLLDYYSHDANFNLDASLKHQASFNLQGKQTPFKYSYTQKSSGILNMPSTCKITGDNTYSLANDTYKATCKLDQVIKLSISTGIKGEMNYL